MKRVKILVCGFSLAIALVALPFPYIDDITFGPRLQHCCSCFCCLVFWKGEEQKMVTNVMCGYIQPVP